MNISNDKIKNIGKLVLQCEDVVENEWDSLSFVFDVAEGSASNPGFLYRDEKAIPATSEIEDKPLVLDDTIVDLINEIAREYGHEWH
ncbi:hypothetical protein [Microbulbifer rhizosphaerae]|uniref:Uncharacterized protein n=1 Tax=Microbulbifer rhizosphaerae TaxID=1562603 RepID=A0A7W4Z7S1_9GAMM|nr:hypothetical protein [Microbulbifer rhizosphaerae]MBB3059786.1 hypothetical protein [Microbulbifer rhizosphaerae]